MDMKYVTVPSAAVALGGPMIARKRILAACRLTSFNAGFGSITINDILRDAVHRHVMINAKLG